MSSEYPWVKGQGSVEQPPKTLPPVPRGRRRRGRGEETVGAMPPEQDEALLPKDEEKPKGRRRRGRAKEGEEDPVAVGAAKPAGDDIEEAEHPPDDSSGSLKASTSSRLKMAAMRVSSHEGKGPETVQEGEDEAQSEEEGDTNDKKEDQKQGVQKGKSFIRQGRGSFRIPKVKEEDLHRDDADPTVKMTGDAVEVEDGDQGPLYEKSLLYVESGADRVFHRKKKKDKDQLAAALPAPGRGASQETLKVFLDSLGAFVASAFIFCQGLLGGISLLQVYLTLNLADRSFLRSFAPIASDVQKAFLFLCTVALVGSLDKWSKDRMAAWLLRGGYQRTLDLTLIVLYALCFLLTLLCTPLEDVMQAANLRSPEWYRWALGDSFDRAFSSWRVLHIFRCLFGLLAWVISSLETRNYLHNAPNKPLHDVYQKMFHPQSSSV